MALKYRESGAASLRAPLRSLRESGVGECKGAKRSPSEPPLVETTRRVVSHQKDAFHRKETRQSETRQSETRHRRVSTKIGNRVVPVFPHGGSSINLTEGFGGGCLDPSSFPTPETSGASASRSERQRAAPDSRRSGANP